MKKLSKKKRKLKKKHMTDKRSDTQRPSQSDLAAESDTPLGAMIVRKKNVFTPRFIEHQNISFASANQKPAEVSQIIFKPYAVEQLCRFIDWGSSTDKNETELQGVLLGSVYETPSGYSGVVDAVLLSEAVGNPIYVESAHSDWAKMDKQMDELNLTRKRKLVKIGWWHTHPKMAIFMSGTDKETQANYFYKDWQFAVVLNPQERKWGAFIGEEARPCVGCFLNNNIFRLRSECGPNDNKAKREEEK